MAYITLNTTKLQKNYRYLDTMFKEKGIEWAVVSKLLCGNKEYLKALLETGPTQICDSRISNLRTIKAMAPHVETVFIKPPSKQTVSRVVEYADISFNTSYDTVLALSEAAVEADKLHRVVIMVELGELREGVVQADLVDFYESIYNLPNIEVIGLGTNLTCMYGILPSYEKLRRLERYRDLIVSKFGTEVPILSGGASVTIPLIERDELPEGINHFRVGETLFFGTDVYESDVIDDMQQNVFKLYAEIIELYEKPNIPFGKMGQNLTGEVKSFADSTPKKSMRAIVDIGLLDIDVCHIKPVNKALTIAGASSDMTVLDLCDNEREYKVGDKIAFEMDYMGVLRIMNSKYVDKRIETTTQTRQAAMSEKVAVTV